MQSKRGSQNWRYAGALRSYWRSSLLLITSTGRYSAWWHPVVRGEFGIGDADYGLITSGFLLAHGIGQLISGPLIDRLGTKRAFSLAAVFWSVATILHALGRGLWSFFTLKVILGIAEAANFPAASKAVAQWFPANERSTAVAIFMLGAGLGAIITAAYGLDNAVSGLAMGLHHSGFTRTGVGHPVAALVPRPRDTPGYRAR